MRKFVLTILAPLAGLLPASAGEGPAGKAGVDYAAPGKPPREIASEARYMQVIEDTLLPGLEKYRDGMREPYCYQSYPALFGSDESKKTGQPKWLPINAALAEIMAETATKK